MGCVESWPGQYAPAGIDGWFVWHPSFDERLDAGQPCEDQFLTIRRPVTRVIMPAKSSHRLCRIAIAFPEGPLHLSIRRVQLRGAVVTTESRRVLIPRRAA